MRDVCPVSRARSRSRAATTFVLVLISASAGAGQVPVGIEQGDRVRVTSEITSGEFVVEGVLPSELSLRAPRASEIRVPISSLTSLEVRRGREISAVEGLFGGGAIGALLGGVLGLQAIQTHYDNLTGMSAKQSIAVGAGLGALIGLLVSRESDAVWEQVALSHRPNDGPRVVDVPGAAREVEPVIVGVGDIASTELVELTVRNRSPDPINAFAWWEGAARVSLGVVRANSTVSFITARRSPGIVLFVNPVSAGPPTGPAPRPSEFIVIGPDERLEWVVLSSRSGVVQDYLRLTPR